MKVSDYIASFLYAQGVRHVFEVVGGMITHLVDSIHCQGKIQLVSTHHEQAAAFAAEAMARITGVPGVAMATSGPGATNLMTAICSCYFDSSPAVFITGQVNRHEQKGSLPIRQLGFQETDIVAMAAHVTKAAWCVQSPEEIPSLLAKAFTIALSGRRGPVLIDIPMDVQRAQISGTEINFLQASHQRGPDPAKIEELLAALSAAKRPLILAGGGISSARVTDLFRKFAEKVNVPAVNSLMAVDLLPCLHPLRVGTIGSYGNRWANIAIGKSDFLLVLGSRLDVRQTGSETEAFKGSRIVYHVDIEAGEINNRVQGCEAIVADLSAFFESGIQLAAESTFTERQDWFAEIRKLRENWPDADELQDIPGINPNQFMHQLSASSLLASAFLVDVGQHQMWAAQSLKLAEGQRFLTSGGMGAMGFALPAAIGAALACEGQPAVMIAGDGGFQMNIQELQTIAHHQLPVKMVVINNLCYGMVRQFQQSYFEERYQSTYWGYSAPDFAKVAGAYGIATCTVSNQSEVPQALEKMWQDPKTPFLLQVMVDVYTNTYPKIAFGRPITEMEPFVKPLEMEST
ncbi:MAG: thiamine pyrophosphate-binding protein [Firmicutes bacterium]|nr:thiamine pyrophosphate-binding protein [Dethiobacter sp.]MCL4462312.1 thiamine pyrophosphate-binding protein [Bacillota bacterium]MCL5993926.1 thiamine pyrophosphate-binding protein [Bacillota bacterium]